MHQCPLCPKSFPSPFKLQRHYVIHTGQKPFTCNTCGKAFTQSGHLKTHLQKVHQQSRFSTGRLRDGILTHDQPAAGSNTQGGGNYTLSSAVSSRPEWKSCFSVGNPPKHIPCVDDGSAAQNRISYVMDAIPQERADSARVDTSVCRARNRHTCEVCFKSFPSSLQLWVHSSSHKKPKQFERGGESDRTFSKKAHLKSQELSSSRSNTTLKHQCPKCLKSFCSPSKLQRHFLIHTGQKPYSCVICWKSFRQKVHLKAHLSTGNQCSAGDERKRLRFRNARQTSALNSSVELELQCKISVNGVQDLNKTEDVVVKTEPPLNTGSRSQNTWYKSDEQEQQYSTRTDLKPFRCVICNRSFRLEVNLMRHHKNHRNQKELGSPTTVQNSDNVKMSHSEAVKQSPDSSHADLCDLNIIVKPETSSENCSGHNDSLPLELITSAGQQRETCRATSKQRINTLHQCCTCLKCFPSASKLQRHTMTHTGQRPFGCEVCGKRFRQKTHLRVHCRTHLWSRYHKQRSLYIHRPPSSLSGCNTKTAADVPLQEMLLHKKDFEAHPGSDALSVKHLDQTPSMVIIQNDNRQPDKKVWPHTSKKNEVVHVRKVSKVKRTQAAQSRHNPGNARHKCFRCLKCFPSASKLQRHEMVHTGLKPFQCGLCGKAFRQAPHLKTHERTHCERKPSRPVNQQGNIRKLKANSQQKRYPRICFRVPPQERSLNTDATLSRFDGAVRVRELLDTRCEKSRTKAHSLFKTNSKSNITCKKRKLHTCRICFKNFAFPYKLSRHMLTHSGIRPYKCSSCSRTFTQRGHQKIHQHRCRQGDRIEMINTNHVQDKCIGSLTDCADFNVDATKDQLPESHYTSAGDYSFTGGDLPYCSEAMHTEWLAVGVGFQEENNESEKRHIENCSQATANYSYSFPSELAFEINKLQNQNTRAPPFSHPYEGNAQNVPCQPKGVTAVPDSNKLLSDEQPDNYWCEPPAVFESVTRTASFKSENDLRRHICSTNIQRKTTESTQKNRCDICLKYFVSPSKLKRHYLVHTGQRPFRCDICGRTFTQSGHVRTHRLTH